MDNLKKNSRIFLWKNFKISSLSINDICCPTPPQQECGKDEKKTPCISKIERPMFIGIFFLTLKNSIILRSLGRACQKPNIFFVRGHLLFAIRSDRKIFIKKNTL